LKTAFVLAAALALAGCGGKKDEKPVEKTPAGSAGSAAGSAVAGSAVDVPTEEDFEASAKTDITTANVDTKVKAIEDQLGSN
jgi:ABC-type glycerol-3-phosphate transport system substrate-binding protein